MTSAADNIIIHMKVIFSLKKLKKKQQKKQKKNQNVFCFNFVSHFKG